MLEVAPVRALRRKGRGNCGTMSSRIFDQVSNINNMVMELNPWCQLGQLAVARANRPRNTYGQGFYCSLILLGARSSGGNATQPMH